MTYPMRGQARVVTPPDPFVTPADVPGTHSGTDAAVAAIIAAVTEEIDGPDGWLGKALGEQTLEYSAPRFTCRLPCPPILSIVSITYLDEAGTEQTLAPANYRLAGDVLLPLADWPAVASAPDAVRIRYQAGYATVPERARQAVILSAQHILALTEAELFLASEEVEGIGSRRYALTEASSRVVSTCCERLLHGLREF